jgi:hypothetical protein
LCTCGRPSWSLVTDLALSLWQLRELTHYDRVELLSARLALFGDLLGGVPHEPGYHRALAREILAERARR